MKKNLKAGRGFTLVELLVVVLILAILMAVALPLYLNAIQNSQRQTARTNMQSIATAEAAYRVQDPGHSYLPITADADFANLKDMTSAPSGPGNRKYKVTISDGSAKCNDAAGVEKTAPNGSIYIESYGTDAANDGCFIPGVTSN